MAKRQQKYRVYGLRGEDYEIPGVRIPGERVIELGVINVDRSCFKKSAKEKEILKLAKLNCRLYESKRS